MKAIYLDYNATTPVDQHVTEIVNHVLTNIYGNPSSAHEYGRQAKWYIENARKQLARLIGAHASEIIFTSGGTESDNLAIKGTALKYSSEGNHIIISSVEHPAVDECCLWLKDNGFRISRIPVDQYGRLNLEALRSEICSETILVSVMHSNNDVGTLQPIAEIAEITRERGILLHTDAAQSVGKVPLDVSKLGVDMLTIAGHKLYAPKGVGALYIRSGVEIEKIMHGASHEKNMRAGTENTAFIAALGKACELADESLEADYKRISSIRNSFREKLMTALPGIRINGHPEFVLPNTLSVGFPGVEAEHFLKMTGKIYASAGAACHAGQATISKVLQEMKVPEIYARGTVRFSLGRWTTVPEIEEAAEIVIEVYRRMTKIQIFHPVENVAVNEESSYSKTLKTFSRFKIQNVEKLEVGENPGCSCKVKSSTLDRILSDMSQKRDIHLLNRPDSNEDACVYRISDGKAIVQSVDFFSPVVADPYDFGAIAAANALSDIYAMGAEPLFALNILAFPENLIHEGTIRSILKGAEDKCAEAGIVIAGGHTVDDEGLKFGLVVTGMAPPRQILYNSSSCAGDVLILTKPLGSGVLLNGLQKGVVDKEAEKTLLDTMKKLNKWPEGILEKYRINACTDITGFGFLGHLSEMTKASQTEAEIWYQQIPLLPGVEEALFNGAHSCTAEANMQDVRTEVVFAPTISEFEKLILNDAQTSGGLLISISEKFADDFMNDMNINGIQCFRIGRMTMKGNGKISVLKK